MRVDQCQFHENVEIIKCFSKVKGQLRQILDLVQTSQILCFVVDLLGI
jgi:hypothetical protein